LVFLFSGFTVLKVIKYRFICHLIYEEKSPFTNRQGLFTGMGELSIQCRLLNFCQYKDKKRGYIKRKIKLLRKEYWDNFPDRSINRKRVFQTFETPSFD